MLSYQVLEYYRFILEKLESMADLLKPIEFFGKEYAGLKDKLSGRIISMGEVNYLGNKTNYSISGQYNTLTDYNANFLNMTRAFNMILFLPMWQDIQKDVFSYQTSNTITDAIFSNYVSSVNLVLTGFQKYYQLNTRPNSYKLSEDILDSMRQREYILSHYKDFIKMIASEAPLDCEIIESNNFLSLQLLQANLTPGEFAAFLSVIDTIYHQISRLTGSPTKLKIIKIESGSFLTTVFGDENIITAIGSLFSRFIDLIFKKFTYEGQIARQVDAMAAIKECIELNSLLDSKGIDTSEANTALIEVNGIIAKKLLLVAKKGGPKIKVNNTTHSIHAELAEKYIGATNTALIEEYMDLSQDPID